jgi:hypothetical protein
MLIYIRVERYAHNPHQGRNNHHATTRVEVGHRVIKPIPFYVLKMTHHQLNRNQEEVKRNR